MNYNKVISEYSAMGHKMTEAKAEKSNHIANIRDTEVTIARLTRGLEIHRRNQVEASLKIALCEVYVSENKVKYERAVLIKAAHNKMLAAKVELEEAQAVHNFLQGIKSHD